jgi:protein required for attachment to host cells
VVELIEPIQIHAHSCVESFDAPDAAVDALAQFLARPGSEPPWSWARALFEDGLVDAELNLTVRGMRRLGSSMAARVRGTGPMRWCVIVADSARARLFTLAGVPDLHQPTHSPLVEAGDLANADRRARDSEVLSDTRPGLRREGPPGPRHGVDDRRDHRRRVVDRRFAESVVDEAARLWSQLPGCKLVVVAGATMLGALREAIARHTRGAASPEIHELARDLTRLSAPALHDALANAGVLPPRGRLAPSRPADIH